MHGAVPLAATVEDSGNVKVLDEDGYLSRNMTTKAYNMVVKELSEFGASVSPVRLCRSVARGALDCSARGREFAPWFIPARYR